MSFLFPKIVSLFIILMNSDTIFGNKKLISKDSVTIHHFDASWLTERERKRGNSLIWRNICRPFLRNARNFLENVIGEERTKLFEAKLRDKIK